MCSCCLSYVLLIDFWTARGETARRPPQGLLRGLGVFLKKAGVWPREAHTLAAGVSPSHYFLSIKELHAAKEAGQAIRFQEQLPDCLVPPGLPACLGLFRFIWARSCLNFIFPSNAVAADVLPGTLAGVLPLLHEIIGFLNCLAFFLELPELLFDG